MKITVIGCGRWGCCIAWYLDRIGHDVTLYGRANSAHMQKLLAERRNEYMTLPESLRMIGARAFRDCVSLEHVRLPAGLEMGMGAFEACTVLERSGTSGC